MAYTSQYPTQDTDHVKATSYANETWHPWNTTDPARPLTGDGGDNQWLSTNYTNQRFHIDLGTGFVIKRIYYEPSWYNGADHAVWRNSNPHNFTFWGSNSATAFAELTYGTDTDWTQLTTDTSEMQVHVDNDVADPKYILVTNSTSYRYYAFKFADNWVPNGWYLTIRRIELQTEDVSFIPPNTPTNSSPANAATGVSRNPTLTGSAFATTDPTNPTHQASQWQIATDSGLTSIVWDSGTTTSNKTSCVVNTTNGTFSGALNGKTKLGVNTTYYWHVRYQDTNDQWSSYS